MEKINPILISGASGFLGTNLVTRLKALGYQNLLLVNRDTNGDTYKSYIEKASFIFHLAGVNRPNQVEEFTQGNINLVEQLVQWHRQIKSKAPIVLSSSTQAISDNPYGKSKKAGEDVLLAYANERKIPIYIYRLTNIFGKWSKPNYNSVVATFCHNVSRDLPIIIHDALAKISLVYIDDVVDELIACLEGRVTTIDHLLRVLPEYDISVGDLANLIRQFKESRGSLMIQNQHHDLSRKLYATYLSYLDPANFQYDLKMNIDNRGSFTELLKTPEYGQVSINISKPGITKGNHYHNTKNEKFIVVNGHGLIRFRKVGSKDVIEYPVDGNHIKVVDIPPGYIHSITNVGQVDLVTVMWASEVFDPQHPDTYPEEVMKP